jgi:uncharacterized protein
MAARTEKRRRTDNHDAGRDPATYAERSTFPSRGRILAEQTKTVSVEESEAYVARSYKERL